MFCVVLCECGTWCLALRQEQTGVFIKRLMRNMLRPKGKEGTSGWKKMHYDTPDNLYSSSNIIIIIIFITCN